MPQVQLPIFPAGSALITPELAVSQRDGRVVYFNGHLPVFQHAAGDLASFRLFTTQLIVNGTASQGQIVQAFGVPLTTVKRYVKKYREEGVQTFFTPAKKRSGNKLTAERLVQAQGLLDEGRLVSEVSAALGILATTVHKAIDCGRLRQSVKKTLPPANPRPHRPELHGQKASAR